MKKLLVLLLIIPQLLIADAVIFSGNDVKTLKPNIDLFGSAKILTTTVDPSSSGIVSPIGSIALRTTTGVMYLKTSAPNTGWTKNLSGVVSLTSDVSGVLPVANGGTGSATQNFVDLTSGQSVAGVKTFSNQIISSLAIGTAPFSITSTTLVPNLYVARAALADTSTTIPNLTGDVTSSGVATTIGAGKVTNSMLAGSIDLTSKVTGALPIANGGSGQTTKAAAFDALSPMTTGGDIIYGGASGTGTRLANGASGTFLQSNGTTLAPSWGSPAAGNLTGAVTSTGLATVLGSFSSSNLLTALTDETGTGAAVFGTAPTFTTNLTAPLLIGGTGTTSTLTYKTTTGTGATGADHIFQVGTNGATEAMRILNNASVGIGVASPNANAIVDITSTTKAFMPPRMTTTQKNAIASPAAGMEVYDTTLNLMSTYNGTSWLSATQSADTDWATCTFATSAWQGLGTVNATGTLCRRRGQDLEMSGRIDLGTVTASQAQFLLPNNWGAITIATNKGSEIPAMFLKAAASTSVLRSIILTSGNNYFNMSQSIVASATNPDTATAGNDLSTGDTIFLPNNLKIPITGWTSTGGTFANIVTTSGISAPKSCSATVSSAGVVSAEKCDFINGNCAVTDTSLYTCTWNTSYWTAAPNCTMAPIGSALGETVTHDSTPTTTSGVFRGQVSAVKTASAFQLVCHGE